MNHGKIIELENQGKILIGIDRPMDRKFYTDIPISEIKSKTDDAPYLEKIIIWFVFLTAPIALISSIILAFISLRWWGLIFLVLFPIIYFSYSASSVKGNSKLIGITIIFICSAVIHFLGYFANSQITLAITVFLLSLWCIRLLYCASTFLLRTFIIRNAKAFEYLENYLVIRNTEQNV
ncbi:MAG: hypothetical protein HY919_01800 [Elusimicrobia bacterium]|nr:hypothetical protein [Elusimicrobiota bacterium]